MHRTLHFDRGGQWVRGLVGAVSLAFASSLPVAAFAQLQAASAIEPTQRSHRQIATLTIGNEGENLRLQDFCLAQDGRIVAIGVDAPAVDQYGLPTGSTSADKASSEVRIIEVIRDPDNGSTGKKVVAKWKLAFAAQAINVGPDGSIYVGGNGRIERYDQQGKLLATIETPSVAFVRENPERFREQAQEQLEEEKRMAQEQIGMFQTELENLRKQVEKQGDKPDPPTPPVQQEGGLFIAVQSPRESLQMYEQMVDSLKQQQNRTLEQMIEMITGRLNQVNAITAGEKDIYIACPDVKGFGYSVWRTDAELRDAQKIVSGLSGCCGQMDIQAVGGEFYVAENSRHRVVRYDREGKQTSSFGKSDREGTGECFGGCCNPMNLCFTADGSVLAAESNGVVKHFRPDGTFIDVMGAAKVPEGCKNSAIGITRDGSLLYYIDIQSSRIAVLERQADSKQSSGQPQREL